MKPQNRPKDPFGITVFGDAATDRPFWAGWPNWEEIEDIHQYISDQAAQGQEPAEGQKSVSIQAEPPKGADKPLPKIDEIAPPNDNEWEEMIDAWDQAATGDFRMFRGLLDSEISSEESENES